MATQDGLLNNADPNKKADLGQTITKYVSCDDWTSNAYGACGCSFWDDAFSWGYPWKYVYCVI